MKHVRYKLCTCHSSVHPESLPPCPNVSAIGAAQAERRTPHRCCSIARWSSSNCEDLAASEQGWARDALSPHTSAGDRYCSAAGFTAAFRARAAEDPRIRLVSLEARYGGTLSGSP